MLRPSQYKPFSQRLHIPTEPTSKVKLVAVEGRVLAQWSGDAPVTQDTLHQNLGFGCRRVLARPMAE